MSSHFSDSWNRTLEHSLAKQGDGRNGHKIAQRIAQVFLVCPRNIHRNYLIMKRQKHATETYLQRHMADSLLPTASLLLSFPLIQ